LQGGKGDAGGCNGLNGGLESVKLVGARGGGGVIHEWHKKGGYGGKGGWGKGRCTRKGELARVGVQI